ncbi:unnamed protein product [Ixodes persulcatus]
MTHCHTETNQTRGTSRPNKVDEQRTIRETEWSQRARRVKAGDETPAREPTWKKHRRRHLDHWHRGVASGAPREILFPRRPLLREWKDPSCGRRQSLLQEHFTFSFGSAWGERERKSRW